VLGVRPCISLIQIYIVKQPNDTTTMSTYTDTYLFQKGEWRCIRLQIQTLPPRKLPGDDVIVSVCIKGSRIGRPQLGTRNDATRLPVKAVRP
jgi:hypothetical protein